MYRQRLYYALKPYLPWRLRIALRRIVAGRTREEYKAVWPINESAGRMPAGWTGWPQGKGFAAVLTHDIEGEAGLAKCRRLAELEMELGFRSSFNFIPEGPYAVPAELRQWLTERGFEVGVHDLEHNGKLYRSRRGFKLKAVRINRYIKDWNACGFRSGFMLRNLDWIHDLDVSYDSSTFDTDPFEFQPEGTGTIFPFWIPIPAHRGQSVPPFGAARGGYVELPYTLPQDSTLFLVFREKTPGIWLRKLDWIAKRGGMALVNVHPDYLCFDGEEPSSHTYSVQFYRDYLRHLREQHAGSYVNLLPRDVATWIKRVNIPLNAQISAPGFSEAAAQENFAALKGKRAAVLLYSDYPADPRPRRAAEAMVESGMEVDVLCLSEREDEPLEEIVRGVRVFRVKLKRRRERVGSYVWLYGRFIATSFWFLARRTLRRKYQVVHVHNMPDFLVFAALIPKLLGARIILDLHDPMPELMTTIFGVTPDSFKIRVLKRLEKWSLGFADAVITVNEACRKIFSGRSCPPEKISVVMNSPDETIFRSRESQPRPNASDAGAPFVLMYHGSLVERHGLDLAVAAVGQLRKAIPAIELRVYGQRTPYLDKVMRSVETSDVRDAVHYIGSRGLEEIAEAITECDVGVIPNRRSVFTELNTPTRIFEYLSQSKPVIAPRSPGILDYFGPDDLVYFELGDVDDLAKKILYVHQERGAVAASVEKGRRIYQNHCWSQERRRFLTVVAGVLDAGDPADVADFATLGATERGAE